MWRKGKIDLNKKLFIITNLCNRNIEHDDIDYEEFVRLMKDNKIRDINFKKRKIQKYYIYYSINENNNIDNPSIKKKIFLKLWKYFKYIAFWFSNYKKQNYN